MSAARMKAFHAVDPADTIRKAIGDISELELFNNQILVGVYVRPNKTASGIHLPDQTTDEDRWQGKVGLVLAKGPMAFKDDANSNFHGQNVKEGEWIAFRPSDGWPITINGQLCRLLEEVHIKARIPAPDYVY